MVLVTTKKAQSGEFTASYNNYFGVQKVTYLPDAVWDPIKVMEGWNTALDNNGQARIYTPEIINEYKEGMKTDPYTYPATNWFDIAFRNAFVQEHNARISGGTEKLQLSFSLGYLDQDGVMIGTDSKKVTFNFNGVAQLSKRFRAGMTASGTYTNFNELHYGSGLAMNYLMRSLPFMPKTLEDGRYGRAWVTTPGQNTFNSIYANAIEGSNINRRTRFLANVFAEYTFPLDIVYKINLGVNKYDASQRVFSPCIEQYNPKTGAVQYAGSKDKQSKSYDVNNIDPSVFQTLNWSKTFKEKHTLSAMLGISYEEFNAYSFDGSSQGFLDNSLIDINAGSKNFRANGAGNVVKLMSYFGRINYDFKDKYYDINAIELVSI
ncbi:MAG: TonB-dependent receptor, partial [Rikenellaceae bacterium]